MHKIYEYLCDELKTLEKKAESGQGLSMAEFEYLNKLTETKKNLLKIEMLEEDSEYSSAMRGGSYRGGNDRMYGDSSYARGRGRNARRDSMGRYSRRGGSYANYSMADKEDLVEDLRDVMQEADGTMKQEFERFIKKIEQM